MAAYPWVTDMLHGAGEQAARSSAFEWCGYERMPLADIYLDAAREFSPDEGTLCRTKPIRTNGRSAAVLCRSKPAPEVWRRLAFDNAFRLLVKHGILDAQSSPAPALQGYRGN